MSIESHNPRSVETAPTTQPRLLTVRQAMVLGAIGKTRLYQAAALGLFTVRKLGRATRIERVSFEAYLDSLPAAKIGTPLTSK
jgi:hypothetical protein